MHLPMQKVKCSTKKTSTQFGLTHLNYSYIQVLPQGELTAHSLGPEDPTSPERPCPPSWVSQVLACPSPGTHMISWAVSLSIPAPRRSWQGQAPAPTAQPGAHIYWWWSSVNLEHALRSSNRTGLTVTAEMVYVNLSEQIWISPCLTSTFYTCWVKGHVGVIIET